MVRDSIHHIRGNPGIARLRSTADRTSEVLFLLGGEEFPNLALEQLSAAKQLEPGAMRQSFVRRQYSCVGWLSNGFLWFSHPWRLGHEDHELTWGHDAAPERPQGKNTPMS